MKPVDIFIAYSHEDLAFKEELKKFLRPMLREGRISLWDDYDIEAGQDWDATIKTRLYGADLVLLLVSSDSLASDYFYGKEVEVSLERHQRGEAVVVPVVLRHCDWEETPLGSLEALPEKGRPVVEWPTRDQAFQDVVTRLRRVVEAIDTRRKNAAAETEALRHFQSAVTAADHLFEKQDWAEARRAYAHAIGLHRKGFTPEKQTLEQRRNQAEQEARLVQKNQNRPEKRPFVAPSRETFLRTGLLMALLLAIGFLFWELSKTDQSRPATLKTIPRPAEQTKPLTTAPDMAYVQGGSYEMGDVFREGGYDEKPVHRVTLSDFYMGKYEVTFEEFDAFCVATGRANPSDEGWGRGRRPVIHVDWYDAVEYCNWLSEQQGLKPVYRIDKSRKDPNNQDINDDKKWTVTADFGAKGYRLPTEAEWEYAARERGRKVRFGNGQDIIRPAEVNFNASAMYKKTYSVTGEYRGKTVEVDSLSANSLGLKHMSGNAGEWCQDWYDSAYYSTSKDARDPNGPASGQFRVVRGGAWYLNPESCRVANRYYGRPDIRSNAVGFRVVRRL
jgi:formylglycine-generating enzyme required for sulfatase activity